MPNLATAYVQIIPTAKGIKNAITNEIGPEAEKAGSESGGKFTSFFSGAIKAGGAAIGTALTAATTAATALVKSAVEGYAEYEQLIGGVETLYGASYSSMEEYAERTGASLEYVQDVWEFYNDRQSAVLGNAKNAYKTAGMSANEYMETVNGFAASLTSSLGQYEWMAGNYADMIVTDMSDNANKMGTDMESIKNAYSGFAKGNFTMLDNLKLGYGGTKEEMERLLRKAEEIEGYVEGSLSVDNFAQVAEAINIIQNSMGITGTTAREAASTIEGSLGMARSSWSNLVTGIADDNADMDSLIGNFVTSIVTVTDNLGPRIQIALEGIGSLVSGLAPVISEKLPEMAGAILPGLIESAITLANGLLAALPEILTILTESVPGDAIGQLATGIAEVLPELTVAAVEIIMALEGGIAENLPELIPVAVSCVIEIAKGLIGELPLILNTALQIITGLAQGILDSIPVIVGALPEIIASIVDFLIDAIPQIIDTGIELFESLIAALPEIIGSIVDALPEIIVAIVGFLVSAFPELVKAGIDLFMSLITNLPEIIINIVAAIPEIIRAIVQGFVDSWPKIKQAGIDIFNQVKNGFSEVISGALQWGKDLIENFLSGITAKWQALKDKVSSIASTVKSFIGFSEPEEGPLSNFHTFAPDMMDLFVSGIEGGKSSVQKAIGEIASEASAGLQTGVNVETMSRMTITGTQAEPERVTLRDVLQALSTIGLYVDGDTLVGALMSRIEGSMSDRMILAGRGATV